MVGIMTDHLTTMLDRYTQARADVDASNADLRKASAERLAQLLKAEKSSALIDGLKDPALIPFDREQLEYAIAERLPHHRSHFPPALGATLRSSLRQARYHWRGLVWSILTIAPAFVFAAFAWENTGESKVSFATEWTFDWTFPDSHTEKLSIPAGATVVAMRPSRDDEIWLRLWDPNKGYGRTPVTGPWFSQYAQIAKRNLLDVR